MIAHVAAFLSTWSSLAGTNLKARRLVCCNDAPILICGLVTCAPSTAGAHGSIG